MPRRSAARSRSLRAFQPGRGHAPVREWRQRSSGANEGRCEASADGGLQERARLRCGESRGAPAGRHRRDGGGGGEDSRGAKPPAPEPLARANRKSRSASGRGGAARRRNPPRLRRLPPPGASATARRRLAPFRGRIAAPDSGISSLSERVLGAARRESPALGPPGGGKSGSRPRRPGRASEKSRIRPAAPTCGRQRKRCRIVKEMPLIPGRPPAVATRPTKLQKQAFDLLGIGPAKTVAMQSAG